MKALVSVIIPVHNTKDYLKESIDSIIAQKEFLHEIIIVNDGSTDGSGELIDKLYSELNFIKIFHTPNQRQGPARNLGTQESTGEYIYYFDSDDISVPGLFKAFHQKVSEFPDLEVFCFSGVPFVDENYSADEETKRQLTNSQYYSRKLNKYCDTGEEAFNLLYPIKSFSPLPYLYIFKKSVIVENKIKFREIRLEDEEFGFQLFLHAGKTLISDEVFCKRRMREGSTMQLNRCFADMYGYMKTIETLEKLRSMAYLKDETKRNIFNKILNLSKAIIMMKVSSRIKLSKDEKSVYKKSLRKYIFSDGNLLSLYYTYYAEYNLRLIKKRLFG